MSDPRLTPDPALLTRNDLDEICVPYANLTRTPWGARDRQGVYGEALTVLHVSGAHSYVRLARDGYHGFICSSDHRAPQAPTHRVCTRGTHAYAEPDIKQPERFGLSHSSQVAVTDTSGAFVKSNAGFIPSVHLDPLSTEHSDPADVAALFLGTPYLWGGNSCWGIDCSGLIQAALLACGIPCPGDSDMQQSLGAPATGPCKRNDLLFWKGHVALITDPDTLIHANAASMSTTYEPIEATIARIQTQGDGPVTAHRRL
mgnify:CR=1 FL=1